ncbi:hypothetical protein BOX15_Mlig021541g1 [Macrostomum lignano]|uniref:Ubiquitin-like domain-containing protein n=2 Tax=Macrostomum lignano TaxID=282301 RepID=A0A267DRP9_9PLAT|nr:hypothetical protein BOX15_Mlig021541g3 [Macrostomum lignano]PAA72333.1 hypothetical protein BOX15_Mlig021541g1 [Macrostomum lignano]
MSMINVTLIELNIAHNYAKHIQSGRLVLYSTDLVVDLKRKIYHRFQIEPSKQILVFYDDKDGKKFGLPASTVSLETMQQFEFIEIPELISSYIRPIEYLNGRTLVVFVLNDTEFQLHFSQKNQTRYDADERLW